MTHRKILYFIIAKFLHENTKPDPGKTIEMIKIGALLTAIPGEGDRDKKCYSCAT